MSKLYEILQELFGVPAAQGAEPLDPIFGRILPFRKGPLPEGGGGGFKPNDPVSQRKAERQAEISRQQGNYAEDMIFTDAGKAPPGSFLKRRGEQRWQEHAAEMRGDNAPRSAEPQAPGFNVKSRGKGPLDYPAAQNFKAPGTFMERRNAQLQAQQGQRQEGERALEEWASAQRVARITAAEAWMAKNKVPGFVNGRGEVVQQLPNGHAVFYEPTTGRVTADAKGTQVPFSSRGEALEWLMGNPSPAQARAKADLQAQRMRRP